jgi:hypothetical protein
VIPIPHLSQPDRQTANVWNRICLGSLPSFLLSCFLWSFHPHFLCVTVCNDFTLWPRYDLGRVHPSVLLGWAGSPYLVASSVHFQHNTHSYIDTRRLQSRHDGSYWVVALGCKSPSAASHHFCPWLSVSSLLSHSFISSPSLLSSTFAIPVALTSALVSSAQPSTLPYRQNTPCLSPKPLTSSASRDHAVTIVLIAATTSRHQALHRSKQITTPSRLAPLPTPPGSPRRIHTPISFCSSVSPLLPLFFSLLVRLLLCPLS